jgi:hypothetical protein
VAALALVMCSLLEPDPTLVATDDPPVTKGGINDQSAAMVVRRRRGTRRLSEAEAQPGRGIDVVALEIAIE